MPNMNNWAGSNRLSAVDTARRAVLCWQRIADKPTSVTFYDPDTQAAITAGAQVVRLEYEDKGNLQTNMTDGQSPKRMLTILGVRSHPVQTDTDVKEGYRFKVDNLTYKVVDVLAVPGEVQATAERFDGN